MEIQDILLAQDVKRWVIVRTTVDQNLAAHSFNVAMIARAIAARMGIDDSKIMKYALDHDLDEIFDGDIPTPSKERNGIKADYRGKSMQHCSDLEVAVVSVADTIDALHFIVDTGNGRHATEIAANLILRYEAKMKKYNSDYPKLVAAANIVVKDITDGEFQCEVR